jgi:hypothetical protein
MFDDSLIYIQNRQIPKDRKWIRAYLGIEGGSWGLSFWVWGEFME